MAELPDRSVARAAEAVEKQVAEAEIVAGLRTGSIKSLSDAYDRYGDLIYGVGYSLLRERADAEDLVHDVFVGLRRAITTYEGRGSFEGWIRRIATRTALMVLRQRRLREQSLLKNADRLTRRAAPLVVDQMDLDGALRQLSPDHRAVFVLKEIHGYAHEEIATMVGISVSAAKVRLHRARRTLRTLLGDD